MHFHQGVPLDISLLGMTCQALTILSVIFNHQNQTSALKKKESLEKVDFFLALIFLNLEVYSFSSN